MKKLLSALLASSVLLAAVPAVSLADGIYTENGVKYICVTVDGKAQIIGVQDAKGKIKIPDEINGCKVTSIESNAFFGQTELEEAQLPKYLESIGASAFEGCLKMTALTIPDSVTSIGDKAFMSCNSLKTVTFGKNVTEIPDECFYACPDLVEAKLPEKLEKIGTEAFFGCPSLDITVPVSVSEIGADAIGMQTAARSNKEKVSISGFLIRGTIGSEAEKYAETYGLDFLDPQNYLAGDINGNSQVEASDASDALAEYSKVSTGSAGVFTKKQMIVGDINLDGLIDASDASDILAEYARLSTGGSR